MCIRSITGVDNSTVLCNAITATIPKRTRWVRVDEFTPVE